MIDKINRLNKLHRDILDYQKSYPKTWLVIAHPEIREFGELCSWFQMSGFDVNYSRRENKYIFEKSKFNVLICQDKINNLNQKILDLRRDEEYSHRSRRFSLGQKMSDFIHEAYCHGFNAEYSKSDEKFYLVRR